VSFSRIEDITGYRYIIYYMKTILSYRHPIHSLEAEAVGCRQNEAAVWSDSGRCSLTKFDFNTRYNNIKDTKWRGYMRGEEKRSDPALSAGSRL